MKSLPFILLAIMFSVFAACNNGDGNDGGTDTTAAANTNPVEAAENANDTLSGNKGDDAEAMVQSAHSGMKEIEMAKHAMKQARSAEVRKVAQHIIDDHKSMAAALKALAAKKNIMLPDSLPAREKEEIVNNDKKGEDYDKRYLDKVIEMHEDDIKKHKEVADESKDGDIKKLFGDAVPKLEKHLKMAKAARESLKQ